MLKLSRSIRRCRWVLPFVLMSPRVAAAETRALAFFVSSQGKIDLQQLGGPGDRQPDTVGVLRLGLGRGLVFSRRQPLARRWRRRGVMPELQGQRLLPGESLAQMPPIPDGRWKNYHRERCECKHKTGFC